MGENIFKGKTLNTDINPLESAYTKESVIKALHDLGYEITDKDGQEFEKRLGEWVIEILQRQMEKHAIHTENDIKSIIVVREITT